MQSNRPLIAFQWCSGVLFDHVATRWCKSTRGQKYKDNEQVFFALFSIHFNLKWNKYSSWASNNMKQATIHRLFSSVHIIILSATWPDISTIAKLWACVGMCHSKVAIFQKYVIVVVLKMQKNWTAIIVIFNKVSYLYSFLFSVIMYVWTTCEWRGIMIVDINM